MGGMKSFMVWMLRIIFTDMTFRNYIAWSSRLVRAAVLRWRATVCLTESYVVTGAINPAPVIKKVTVMQ